VIPSFDPLSAPVWRVYSRCLGVTYALRTTLSRGGVPVSARSLNTAAAVSPDHHVDRDPRPPYGCKDAWGYRDMGIWGYGTAHASHRSARREKGASLHPFGARQTRPFNIPNLLPLPASSPPNLATLPASSPARSRGPLRPLGAADFPSLEGSFSHPSGRHALAVPRVGPWGRAGGWAGVWVSRSAARGKGGGPPSYNYQISGYEQVGGGQECSWDIQWS